ncbi:MAG: hypothetical protein AB1756_06690 [Acidobacteriota bacterium]
MRLESGSFNLDYRAIVLFFALIISIIGAIMINRVGFDIIYALVWLILSALAFLNPLLGLFAIVITFPFMVGFSSGIDILEVAFALLFSSWFAGWIARFILDRSGDLNFDWHPLTKIFLALMGILVTSATVGFLNGAGFKDIFRDFSQYAGYIVFFPAVGLIRSRKAALGILLILFLTGLPCFIWSAFVWWARKFFLQYGMMNAAKHGSQYLGPLIGALWPLFLLKTKRWIRFIVLISLFLLALYALGSGYRHQLTSFLFMTAVAAWSTWGVQSGIKRLKVIAPLIIGITFFFWTFAGILGYLPMPGGDATRKLYSSLIVPENLLRDPSVEGRLLESQYALKMFQKYPVFGLGLGHHVKLQLRGKRWFEESFSQHIWITEMLMKFGLVGALVFLWFFYSILRFSFKTSVSVDNLYVKAISLGVLIWICISLLPTAEAFSDHGFTLVVGLMLGLMPAFSNLRRSGDLLKDSSSFYSDLRQ